MHVFRISLTLIFVILGNAFAQQAPDPAPAAIPAVAEPDPKLKKEYEALLTQKFSRDPAELLRNLERIGVADPATLPVNSRFLLRFVTSDWKEVRAELALMPDDFAGKVYQKMLNDLTENRKPVVRLEDVVGLADAAPAPFTPDNLRKLGQILGIIVPVSESYWLVDLFQKGTETLGGSDPAKRLLAARVLLAGGFKDLARTYLPSPDELEEIADLSVRAELMAFAATQEQRESVQRTEVQRLWDDNIGVILSPGDERALVNERSKAIAAIAKVITQVPESTLAPVLGEMVTSQPDSAIKLLVALERKIQAEQTSDVETRTANLAMQASVASLLSGQVKPGEQPWAQIIEMMADLWTTEAEHTFVQKALPNPQKFVLPEDLLAHAPTGKWAEAIPAAARDRIDVAVSRLILSGAQFDRAAERIIEIGKRSPVVGAALAEDFLGVWARNHNPEIPEALRKKFSLPDDARIPVTPIMMEKNIEALARMMDLFREAGIAPSDYSKVVEAFDLAYSDAETYRTSHIEKVFGSMTAMDEPLFILILSRMSGNLGQRWRTMAVQKAGMTQRDEAQTLALVRDGYATALQLIENWADQHREGSRALTLAGTLLVDWGDFEYFQELVSSDAGERLAGYREKNLLAQDYFDRGATTYGRQVAALAPADYRVDAYLDWFNGLLGIGSNGQINLSKAINRGALTRLREHLAGLPGAAAKAHRSLFAKIVNDRLSDEANPLHEDLKYRYLASALLITQDDPFTLAAEKKVAYLDQLLSEVRLQTRVDGPTTVGRDQDFGILVSIVHTEAMGRAAHFGQYLSNDANAGLTRPTKTSPLVRKMQAAQGPRDQLELNLTTSLAPFFEIRSITFATPEVKSRPTDEAGWEETTLAYLHVRAKDASVDKIPPVQLDLKFIDLSGPITIPAESAETVIKVATDGFSARPASQIEITQTLDARQLNLNGTLVLEVKATSSGLVPDLDELLDLEGSKSVTIRNINAHEGLQITELNTWGDEVAPRSERLWTISLDGDQVRAAETAIDYFFPRRKVTGATAIYQAYTDMNLTTLTEPVTRIGREPTPGEVVLDATQNPFFRPILLGGAGLFLLALVFLILRRKRPKERPLRARDVFIMPAQIDGFAVVALLRRLGASPLVTLKAAQKEELQSDLKRIEQVCFGSGGDPLSESDLRGLAAKWLRSAT